jgi:hypothetical protein
MPDSSPITAHAVLRATRQLHGPAFAAIAALVFSGHCSAAETTVVIEGCSLFDSESAALVPDQTLVIRGPNIVHVAGKK